MKYRFMKEYCVKYPLAVLCRVLDVSRSAYYAWLKRVPGARELRRKILESKVWELFYNSRRTYGILSVLKGLIGLGWRCGKNLVQKVIRGLGLYPKTHRQFKATTNSKHKYPVSENILNREFTADAPDRKWVGDITYIPTEEGWLYLAFVLDLYSRKIIGWSMKERMKADLVMDAFSQAVGQRNPLPGLLFHSDRGSQYACHDFRKLLADHKAVSSMSRKGDCWDNAVAESFIHTLKTELVYHEKYRTREEAKKSIFEYIEVFYNRGRRHSALNYATPVDFERLRKVA